MTALLAIAAIGAVAQAYGEYKQGEDNAAYLREKSQNSLIQADEGIARANLNVQQIIREGRKFRGDQVASYAGAGVDISSNATLSALEDTSSMISDQIYKTQREAEFEAFMNRKEAYSYEKAARDTQQAARIGSATSIAKFGGTAALSKG
jgi:hypothetical protein